jgi:hypothetical protein
MARWLALLPLAALLGCAEPEAPARTSASTAGIAARPAAAPARDGVAPLPNRAIEAPGARGTASLNPTLEPMMLPPERARGFTFGGEHLRETGPDRPFDGLVPGARLRIPFE